MGNEVSLQNDLLDSETTRKLAKKFSQLDLDKSGTLTVQEIMSIPSLKQNPILKRVISVFDVDNSGSVDFKEFIDGLLIFSSKSDKQKRLKFMFNIYDINKDGYISNGDLFSSLKLMVGDNLMDEQLQQIVDKTIIQLDLDEDGRISFDEFVEGASHFSIYNDMNLDLNL